MLRLRTFGGLSIEGDSLPLKGAAGQRKPLALLALLAGSGNQGISKDRLTSLLWPESSADQASNLLRQRLFHLRRDLNAPELVTGTVQLRLNPDVISSDATDFESALDRADLNTAATLYSGPFLDGFHMADSHEFERWSSERREYFAQSADKALQRLAENAAIRGNSDEAVEWWRRRALLQPLDSRIAAGFIKSLAAAGDSASALRHAQLYEARLADELGVPLDAELSRLVEQLRSDSVTLARRPQKESGRIKFRAPLSKAVSLPDSDADASAMSVKPGHHPSDRRPSSNARNRWRVAITLLLAGVVSSVLWLPLARSHTTEPSVAESVVAVFPFSVRGNSSYSYLREGVPDLLNIRLNGAGRLRSVDPRALVGIASADAGRPLDASSAKTLSTRVGADQYVLGDAIESGGSLQLVATLYDRGGKPVGQAEVDGSPAQLAHLVDELATRLLASVYKTPSERLLQTAALTTSSFTALKSYLLGEQDFRAGRYAAAADAFQRAAAEDTTFALAYYRLSVAAEWAPWAAEVIDAAAARAVKLAARLPERDRDLFGAFLSRRRGDFDDAERRYRTIVSMYPDELEAWYQLGEIQFHYDPLRGLPLSAAKESFERVMFLRPTDAETLAHLLRIAALARDRAAVDTITRRLLVLSPAAAQSPGFITFRAAALGDSAGIERGLSALANADDEAISVAMRHVGTYVQDFSTAERIAAMLTDTRRSVWYRSIGYGASSSLLLAQGQIRAAHAALERHEGFDPDWSLELRGIYTALPFLPPNRVAIDSMRIALAKRHAQRPMRVPPGDALSTGWDVRLTPYALALLAVRSNDASAALNYATQLEHEKGSTEDSAFLRVLAGTVRAELARARGNYSEALQLLGSEQPEGTLAFLGGELGCQVYQRFLRAELLHEVGRDKDALRWYSSLVQSAPHEASFLGPAHLRQAQIYDRLGDKTEAVRHYQEFVTLWRDADPELRPLVSEALKRLARLR